MIQPLNTEHTFQSEDTNLVCNRCGFKMRNDPAFTYSHGFYQSEEYLYCDNIG